MQIRALNGISMSRIFRKYHLTVALFQRMHRLLKVGSEHCRRRKIDRKSSLIFIPMQYRLDASVNYRSSASIFLFLNCEMIQEQNDG